MEDRAIELHQVHLVDGQHERRDAQQPRNPRVPHGLRAHAVTRVDEQDREVGRRSARRHVPRVLFVAGRIGQDEFAARGREIAVRHVDRDALLALGAEAVGEQREIDRTGGAVPGRRAYRVHLVLVDARASRRAAARSACSCRRPRFRPCRCAAGRASEVALALLDLHRTVLVVVDDAKLALGIAGPPAAHR